MQLKCYNKDGLIIHTMDVSYIRNAGIHNGVVLFGPDKQILGTITSVLGEKEAVLSTYNPGELTENRTERKVHHWMLL